MRHRISGRQFGLPSDQRRALLKGLVRSLFRYDKIVTTETRAKDLKPIAEKLITIAKRNDQHSRRLVRQYVDSNVSAFGVTDAGKIGANPEYVPARLFDEIAPRYKNRNGGYTRITKIGRRRGDNAPMVLLELVEGEEVHKAASTMEPVATTSRRKGLFGRKG